MKEHYSKFKDSVYALFSEEEERLKIEFDEGRDYTEIELSSIIGLGERDLDKAEEWYQEVSEELRELWKGQGSPENQNDINEAYKLIATKISIRKGGPLKFGIKEIDELIESIVDFDDEFDKILNQRFTFLKNQFASKIVGLDGDTTINLRIDNATSKCRSFFGSSLASFLHILRSCTTSEIGLLSRLMLSRALFEIAIHNIYITRKLKRITDQIKDKSDAEAIEKLELFNNHFLRGMFGTKSPETDAAFPNPFNILTCIQEVEKENIGAFDYETLNNFYAHLCDYAHPNYLMRNLICEIGPAKGDYFSYEVFVDKEATGNFNASRMFHYLLQSLNYSIRIFKQSSEEMKITFTELQKINDEKGKAYREKLKKHNEAK